MSTTGERIKQLRIARGMTQEELGAKIGVKLAAINKYETGIIVNLKRSTIQKLADALDTTPIYLMGWEDPAPLSAPELSPLQQKVVAVMDNLNIEGQEKVLEYTEDLAASGRYIKSNEDGVVETA